VSAKPKDAEPSKKKSKPTYPDEVRAAAKAVRDALPDNAKAPGPKQVAAVVKALGDDRPAARAGISKAKLKAWAATGERPDDYAKLRPLAKAVGDPWATGRRLAAILVALESAGEGGQ
jgi:hypothetical protein